jgi:hypothetical protein
VSISRANSNVLKLPEGYVAIPASEDQKSAVLKICVLARLEADPAGGHLVVLRETLDAKVFLGCISDAAGRVQEWVELWVQSSEGLIKSPSLGRQAVSNSMLDTRWRRQLEAFERLDGGSVIETGWESVQPLPTFLRLSDCCPVHPVDDNLQAVWRLCTDEGLLQAKGLPCYGSSLHRYLYVPGSGEESKFVPVTSGAPTNESTKALSEILGEGSNLIPFNPQAGLVLVKSHAVIGLETFIDILSGASWDGLKHGRTVLELGEEIRGLRKNEPYLGGEGRLLLDSEGRLGRLAETLHLKLRLLADMASSVEGMVGQLQRPLLNLRPESWQVRVAEPGHGLPFLWAAKPVLCDPGDAVPVAVERSDVQYYLPPLTGETSIYRPLISSVPVRGRASVRIRQVLPDADDTMAAEGTFATQERIEMASRDLVWFRVNLSSGPINLYAHLEADSALAQGEWRFRTVAQHINETEVWSLRGAEGVPMPDIPFEIVPLLSSPCDLYSLAVMAVRIFMVDNTNSLPEALDETLSLTRQVEADRGESSDLGACIRNIFSKDRRWVESLGAQHLTFDEITAEEAFGLIPPELWWTTLGIIVRMLPGAGRESECRDFGDAQPGGLHKVFERTIRDLDRLIRRTRSLVVGDWRSNIEISGVIQKYLT